VKLQFKQPPMGHQLVALRKAWPYKFFALFHEMGTGKTYTGINLAAARYNAGQIDACIVFCPSAIKSVWYNDLKFDNPDDECELKKFCPIDYSAWVFESGDHPHKWMRKNGQNSNSL